MRCDNCNKITKALWIDEKALCDDCEDALGGLLWMDENILHTLNQKWICIKKTDIKNTIFILKEDERILTSTIRR